ncbi:hypothetical protein [Serratia marcescens]|uniref:hypothetical protein n=1 Tax=Serratia marcescens TaxID=615 RepID=UPI0011E80FBC|nr:hypothetical protein [Serratia marcescens]
MKLANLPLLIAVLTATVGLSLTASAAERTAGYCPRIYAPVPYVTKEGKTIQAPNACIAKWWATQGK